MGSSKFSFNLLFILIISALKPSIARCQVPSSERSNRVIARTSPIVKQELAKSGMQLGQAIFLRVFKQENQLELWVKGEGGYRLFKTYKICYYSGELGPKIEEGDGQSPEGFYFVRGNSMNPWSSFHLSMNVGYPNKYDRSNGYTGDYIMIHGDCVSIGCYAMTDPGIEEIYTIASAVFLEGQPYFRVHIFPFRMTEANMLAHRSSEWYSFWLNLKTGYDWFEEKGVPPNVEVMENKYVFN